MRQYLENLPQQDIDLYVGKIVRKDGDFVIVSIMSPSVVSKFIYDIIIVCDFREFLYNKILYQLFRYTLLVALFQSAVATHIIGVNFSCLGCSAFCYTQLTDVQQEVNGLVDMDRRDKFSPEIIERIRNINQSTGK